MAGWYKSHDKKAGRENNLTTKHVEILVNSPCSYCEGLPAPFNGVDRKDSNIGHTVENSVPSCFKCNIILGTLDYESKKIMSKSLIELRKQGLLEKWDPPKGRPFSEEINR